MDRLLFLIFQLAVLLFSVMIHEVSHGMAALKLGDTTAKDEGRLTLNPLKHLDFFGSFLLPLLLALSRIGIIIGWAKPVPINPNNLKNPKKDSGLIGIAGPISNLLLAVVFGTLMMFVPLESAMKQEIATIAPYTLGGSNLHLIFPFISSFWGGVFYSFTVVVFLNILLVIFNLVPLPPLDGSNILFSLLPRRLFGIQEFLMRYGFWILILFLLFGFQLITPIISIIYRFLVGPAALF